jgi:uncharacterized protein YjdB
VNGGTAHIVYDGAANTGLSIAAGGNRTLNYKTPTAVDFTVSGLTQIYDGSPKSVTVTANSNGAGIVTGTYYTGTGGTTYGPTTAAPTNAGTYGVTVNVAEGAWNGGILYLAATGVAVGTLTIQKAAQPALTISGLDDSYSYGDAPFNLSTSGGGAVSYTSDTTDVASVSGNTVTIHKAGTFRITATRAADENYNQALATSGVVTVRESTPHVALVASGGGLYGDDTTLAATVSRVNTGAIPGGTVTFREGSATLGTATLDGAGVATVTIVKPSAGSHTYTAEYAGEAGRYYKANSDAVTVTLAPADGEGAQPGTGGDPDANADKSGLDGQTPTGPAVDAPANVVKIRTPLTTVYLTKNKTYKIPCVLDTVNGKAINDSKLKVTSSKPKIAKVVKSGTTYKIKALKKGKATITIQAQNGTKKAIKVVVQKKNIVLKKFAVKAPKSLKKGKTYHLKISKRTKNASNISTVTFKSSNRKIATVDKAGKIKAVKKGKVKITIKVGKKKLTKTIRIK